MRDSLGRRAGRYTAVVVACAFALMANAQTPTSDEPMLLDIKRFVVQGNNPLSAEETEAVLKPYLGPHTSLTTLETAASTLQEAIRSRGFSFHRVIVPAQQPSAGDLTLQILPFVIGDISIVGNQHFSTANIRRSLPGLKPGAAPNLRLLSQEISLANEHPSKRLTLQIKEGTKPDTVDADVRVADVSPSQFFAGLIAGTRDVDNTVNKNTGYTRLTVGYQHSNLFDLDHSATLAYTTSPDHVSDVSQYGVFYTAPLYPFHTIVTGYYTRSDINSGIVGIGSQSFGVSGVGEFYGLKARYALPKIGNIGQNLSLGWDRRYFKSNVDFEGSALPASTVGSSPVSVGYGLHSERGEDTFAAEIEYVFNTSGGRANDSASYEAARPGARRSWDAIRFSADATRALPKGWTLKGRLRAQYSNDALIPGEQLGIAGLTAVRGFREREVTGDRAYVINVEAHAPRIGPGFNPFVFVDAGGRRQVIPVLGPAPTNEFISSVGAGVRWQWQQLEVSALWAIVTNASTDSTRSGYQKAYLSAFYRF